MRIRQRVLLTRIFVTLISSLFLLATSCQHEKRYKIGVSQCSYDDWRLKLNDELERQALVYPDMDLEITCAYDDPVRQQEDIRHLMATGVDVIITSPHDSANLNDVLREARKEGIKVVVFDRLPSEKNYDVFVGADNPMLGRAAGKFLLRAAGPSAKFMELWGQTSTSPARGRHQGFREAIEGSGATCVAEGAGEWNEEDGFRVADSLLRLHPEVNAIFAHNDRMAIGARKAARKAGRPDIVIAGVDAVPELGIKAVADSTINATFIYPTAGTELIDIAMKVVKGEDVKDEVIISSAQPVLPENASILLEIAGAIDDQKSKVDYLRDRVNLFTTRHTEQRILIIAIISIVILLALVIFVLLKAFWQNRRNQAMLYMQNAQLMKQRDELEELNLRLNEATRAKLIFFTNVSHDLRTPLTLISEPVARLRTSPNLTPDERVLMRLADKNVKILQRLINQILDFSKYEDGKLNLRLEEIDLRRYMEEWAESFRHLAHKRHIHFEMKIGEMESASVAVDPGKLERIFFNLMSNAFKFTPANGTITVEVSLAGGNLTLRVADTGHGMDAETLAHVFERFYQAEKVEPQGSGIGLALVKAFVDLHAGNISVESTPGKGTAFTIVIPEKHLEMKPMSPDPDALAQTEKGTAPTERITDELDIVENPSLEEIDDSKPCVLVIDDTADIRTLVHTLLKEEYTVLEAGGGKQGIKLAAKYIPDLIICDVMMPDLGGMECVRRLKEEISTSHIPVLMLTACSLDEQRAEGYESGADGYLSKPFDAKVLIARCHSLIANRRRLLSAGKDLASPAQPARSAADVAEAAAHEPARSAVNSGAPEDPKPAKRVPHTADPAMENEFYQRFMKIIDKEMGNPEITVEEMGSRLGLSRVQFYRKIKALTNYSPNEILRIRRLKHAYSELTKTERTVAEIAYSVGFSSPGYFSKCFREYFGELPADLQKRTSKIS